VERTVTCARRVRLGRRRRRVASASIRGSVMRRVVFAVVVSVLWGIAVRCCRSRCSVSVSSFPRGCVPRPGRPRCPVVLRIAEGTFPPWRRDCSLGWWVKGGGCRGVVLEFSHQGLDFGPEEGGFHARRVLCFEEGFVRAIICICLLKEGFQRVFHPEKAFSLGTSRVHVIRSHRVEVVVRLAPEFFVSSLGVFQVLREAFNAAIQDCESVRQVPA
jgi:hypothetical protein